MNAPDLPIDEGQMAVVWMYGAYPLWNYIQEVIGVNIVEVCSRVAKEEPLLTTDRGTLVARTVALPYSSSLDSTFNNDKIFLLNSINVVFESLKSGVEMDGSKLLDAFKFKLDSNHNMYLVGCDSDIPISAKGIGIVQID
jgi:hypothetical protein